MEYYSHINSNKKKLYPSYDALPPCAKKVYSALLLMCTDASYKDEELEFMPTNCRDIWSNQQHLSLPCST